MPSRGLTFLQEIRDAVAVAERLVLVVGPAALRSDYVRAEWQYALALSKPVIPVLRIGEMEALPPEVGRVHCIDARATRPAQDAFDELARVLRRAAPAARRVPDAGSGASALLPAAHGRDEPTRRAAARGSGPACDGDRAAARARASRAAGYGQVGDGGRVRALDRDAAIVRRRGAVVVRAAGHGGRRREASGSRRHHGGRRTGGARGDRRRERARGGRADPEPSSAPVAGCW